MPFDTKPRCNGFDVVVFLADSERDMWHGWLKNLEVTKRPDRGFDVVVLCTCNIILSFFLSYALRSVG